MYLYFNIKTRPLKSGKKVTCRLCNSNHLVRFFALLGIYRLHLSIIFRTFASVIINRHDRTYLPVPYIPAVAHAVSGMPAGC